MSPKYAYTPRFRGALFALLATLFLAGCMSEDDKRGNVELDNAQVGSGEVFHGAEWATIKNLDPRGEQCIDCHGKNNDMSPYNSGFMAHNVGLQKNDTPESLGVSGLKITKVNIDEESGRVTVTTNKPVPASANLTMTFAKLAPRVVHDRGHDWQNYFASNALGFGESRAGAENMMLKNGGVQPQTVPNPQISGNTITFNLGDGEGRSWGEHDFDVRSAYETDTDVWSYQAIRGTKFNMVDISEHVYCDEAHANSNQVLSIDGTKPVCWWPDGTHLTAGVFVSDNNEFIVKYEPEYTHRVTIIIGGQPGYNTWYDFVPSTGEAFDATTYSALDGDGKHENQKEPAAREVVDVQSCNSCHDSLSMHGGSRATTQTCVTCHNPGNLQASSGRSVDFKQLIHRIHRGENLPSEAADIAELMDGKSLVASHATDFTKVRFPQGPTPGQAAGITNCVKCHMGEKTKDMVQGLADALGPNDFDVQSKMKLAKVTPQGDNWLSVRSVNACQACHDSNVWFASGNSVGTNTINNKRNEAGTTNPTEQLSVNQLDKYMAFYSDKYSGVGFDWLGKKLSRNNEAGWVHNTNDAGASNRFTCGSGGGCHGNPPLDDSVTPGPRGDTLGVLHPDMMPDVGNRQTNAIQQVHLELTRNFILAERFEIEINNEAVDSAGKFTAQAQIIDKQTGNPISVTEDNSGSRPVFVAEVNVGGTAEELTVNASGQLGWMLNSPDYNHSAGSGIPGSPVGVSVVWDGDTATLTADLTDLGYKKGDEWSALKANLDKAVGTVFVQLALGDYRPQTAVKDFRFDGNALAGNEGRRKVVDFTAGNGVINADSVEGWDKHDGANTQSCSSCHLQLAYHNSRTNNVQACVVCHNPQRTDLSSRGRTAVEGLIPLGEDGQYEESLDFKRLIHAIHSAPNKRIDPLHVGTSGNTRPSTVGERVRGHSFPGVISNCKSCHIEDENSGKWTFDLTQLPEGMIGSTAITGDWENEEYAADGSQHDFNNHLKMSPIASVCSSCHDAGYKTSDGRMNPDILDGGPYVGSHWWQMGGIAPGIVRPGNSPQSTKHQSGK